MEAKMFLVCFPCADLCLGSCYLVSIDYYFCGMKIVAF